MAVDSSFASLLHNIKLEDPWLPPKTWESIATESGLRHSENQSSKSCPDLLQDPNSLSEVNLVRLLINALQGLESALISIQKLSEFFCTEPADRTLHRIPCLWQRFSSSNALGKILMSIGSSGVVALLLRKFVDYFIQDSSNVSDVSIEEENKIKQVEPKRSESGTAQGSGTGSRSIRSLVNQSFAIAVEKVLEGYICSLDTLYESVKVRRSPTASDPSSSSVVGCLTSVVHSDITLLEVYLHTKELRNRIEALGNICRLKDAALAFSTSSLQDLTSEAAIGFFSFPKGADLLTYLYAQLRDADPVHSSLLKYLFTCSWEPYCIFIKSWIYQARIDDPFEEFMVEYKDDSAPDLHGITGIPNGISLLSAKLRAGGSVPCFLEDYCLPLLRAGQQLQVLNKLLNLCHILCPGDHVYEGIIPYWDGSLSNPLSNWCPLTFSKCKMQNLVLMRESLYHTMQEKLQIFFTRLDTRRQQIHDRVMPLGAGSIRVESIAETEMNSISFTLDETSPSNYEIESYNLYAGTDEYNASSPKSEFYEMDGSESSECSSLCGSAEQNESAIPSEPHVISIEDELGKLSDSRLLANLSHDNVLPNPSQNEKPHPPACSFGCSGDGINPIKTSNSHFHSVDFWPIGRLLKNPFHDDGGNVDRAHFRGKGADRSKEVLDGGNSYFSELLVSEDSVEKPKGYYEFTEAKNEARATDISSFLGSWDLKLNSFLFNINPILMKNAWFHDKRSMGYSQLIPYFDFSVVEDPCKSYEEILAVSRNHEWRVKLPLSTDVTTPATGFVADTHREKYTDGTEQRNSTLASSSSTLFNNIQVEKLLVKPSGGANWESSLNYLGKSGTDNAEGRRKSSRTTFDMPIDVVIDKCVIQEILLQYKYISNFTIKLLEEGFDLQQHLLALRRYHFMEYADWADLFIMALRRHKWHIAEASQSISEIQGFLDSAVQRSSCDRDPHKERLFVYIKSSRKMPPPTSVTAGVHAFDYIALGYRVEWPVSMILSASALKVYADIFSFLIQVRLAVISLTDVWCSLKNLLHLVDRKDSGFSKWDKSCCNIFIKMRYQITQFVSTLQQYVQSQLSHVSWSKFVYSLKHQVKDMFDFESLHMAYLADSLHLCFLSDEEKQVALIIKRILQCALDFHAYFTGNCWEVGSHRSDSSRLLDRFNFSQVLTIKETFDKNLRELYICYLKSPRHRDFSISRFWEHLNYNDYYSDVIGVGINQFAF
ncbi:hypothetical protein Sjap_012617 [Stephania japonica]|uniref:Gamma-tubulin complex component n=1 Tax=Stephania japonica TaxID=461633 RepID=A0AAP0IXJ1_9MAGN